MNAPSIIAGLRGLAGAAGLPVWDDTPDVVRLVALRRTPGIPDAWCDAAWACWRDRLDGQDYALAGQATTVPGLVGPGWTEGIQVPGYVAAAYQVGIMHAGTQFQQTCLIQTEDTDGIPYWPSKLRSDVNDQTPVLISGGTQPIKGLEWHNGAGLRVGLNSLGCIVSEEFARDVLPVIQAIEKRGGPKFYARWLFEVPADCPWLDWTLGRAAA